MFAIDEVLSIDNVAVAERVVNYLRFIADIKRVDFPVLFHVPNNKAVVLNRLPDFDADGLLVGAHFDRADVGLVLFWIHKEVQFVGSYIDRVFRVGQIDCPR